MNLECPYCEHEIEDPEDCYKTDTCYEYECNNCNKTFTFFVEYSRNYNACKAPCLNGGDHDWKPRIGFPAEWFKDEFRCSYCKEEKTIKEKEGKK